MQMRNEIWDVLPNDMRPKIRFWVPAAQMNAEDLRNELRGLKARGFGGVEVVVLSTLPSQIASGENGWGTDHWNQMVAVIAEETSRLGLTMDLANGPGWPIAAPGICHADDPAALTELTYGVVSVSPGEMFNGQLPERRKVRPEGTPKLIAAMAYQEKQDGTLCKDSYINLDHHIQAGILTYTFPLGNGHAWKLFSFYQQPACQRVNANQTYVIDHLSEDGVAAMEKYWEGVFEDNTYPSMESFFCDSLEYDVAMDWTDLFAREFETRRGYSILPYLPFVGLKNLFPACDIPGFILDDVVLTEQINNDYLEVLTQLHCENHLAGMERMAQKFGKTLRYQVAYNKPFEADRCAMAITIPENEALGRAAVDFQRIMASAAHVGKKKRYSFECAAEFGHSYGQSYEDLFWWIKRSYMAGMNAQVLHGASYSGEYPDAQWPGYEGFGKLVSNYWNRTLSVPHARGCMDAITRMNILFRKTAKVDCAVYRSSYHNDGLGSEFCLYPDGGELSNNGYSYDFLSETLLEAAACSIHNRMLDAGNTDYRCLIIPEQRLVSKRMLLVVEKILAAGVPVIWVGNKPVSNRYYAASDRNGWQEYMNQVWDDPGLIHIDTLSEVPRVIPVPPRIKLETGMDIMSACRADRDAKYYALYGYNRVCFTPENPNRDEIGVSSMYRQGTVKGSYQRPGQASRKTVSVSLEGNGAVYLWNPWDGTKELLSFTPSNGRMLGCLDIEEDELLILSVEAGQHSGICESEMCQSISLDALELYAFGPDTPQETSFLRSGFAETPTAIRLSELKPWKDMAPDLISFSGKGVYHGSFTVSQTEIRNCILEIDQVSDTFTVKVNGIEAPFPDQVMHRANLTGPVHSGENTIEITVVSNLYNRLFDANTRTAGIPLPYRPRNYGIWSNSDGDAVKLYIR